MPWDDFWTIMNKTQIRHSAEQFCQLDYFEASRKIKFFTRHNEIAEIWKFKSDHD